MGVMYRYLKSKVESKHVFLILTKCEFCPYFMKNTITNKISCAFSCDEETNNNIIKEKVSFKFEGGVWTTQERVSIPEWCKLNTNINVEQRKEKIIYKFNGIIHEATSIEDESTKKVVIPDSYIRYKSYTDTLEYNAYYYEKVVNRRKAEAETQSKPIYALPAYSGSTSNFNSTPVRVVLNVCSKCGVGKEGVDRTTNDGMCDECFNEYKNNKDILTFVRINNFRLKRNSFWSENKFKVVEKFVLD